MTPKSGRSILHFQTIGFALLITCAWLVEILHIPHLLYGVAAEFDLSRVLIRTGVVLAIWVGVHLTTRRLLRRLHELEGFLRLCSWCRRIEHDGNWLTIEEFFNSRLATETSHGICPDCAVQQFPNSPVAARTASRPPK